MEESLNGKLEEAQAVVEVHDEEIKGLLSKEESAESKPQVESEREINDFDDGNPVSEPVNGDGLRSSSSSSSDDEAEADEKSPEVENCGDNLEEKEKVVSDHSNVETFPVEKSGDDSDVVELNSREKTEEKIPPSVDENIDGISAVPKEVVSNGLEKTTVMPSDETSRVSAAVEDVEERENEEPRQPSLNDTNGFPAVPVDSVPKAIEEKTGPSEGDNNGIPPAPPEESRETEIQIPISSETAGESDSRESANAPAVETRDVGEVGNKPEITEGTEKPVPIVSVSRRALQPTSWKSCCGIFEVLRRDR